MEKNLNYIEESEGQGLDFQLLDIIRIYVMAIIMGTNRNPIMIYYM